MAKRFGFGKSEKLKSRKKIDELFTSGKSFATFPLRTIYNFSPTRETAVIQVGVTVNKKNFKKAVDRNKIKRLLREAYRLQKLSLTNSAKNLQVKGDVFFMYTNKTIDSFEIIKDAMGKAVSNLERKLAEAHANPS